MDDIREKELKLEKLEVEEEIQKKRTSIAEAKALEKRLKREYGPKWRSILGVLGKLTNSETRHTLYGINPNLREYSKTNVKVRA